MLRFASGADVDVDFSRCVDRATDQNRVRGNRPPHYVASVLPPRMLSISQLLVGFCVCSCLSFLPLSHTRRCVVASIFSSKCPNNHNNMRSAWCELSLRPRPPHSIHRVSSGGGSPETLSRHRRRRTRPLLLPRSFVGCSFHVSVSGEAWMNVGEVPVHTCLIVHITRVFFFSHFYFPASGQAVVLRCRPFFPKVLAFNSYRVKEFSNPTARRVFIECC